MTWSRLSFRNDCSSPPKLAAKAVTVSKGRAKKRSVRFTAGIVPRTTRSFRRGRVDDDRVDLRIRRRRPLRHPRLREREQQPVHAPEVAVIDDEFEPGCFSRRTEDVPRLRI